MKMTSRGLLLLMGLLASTGLVRESGAQGITFQSEKVTLFTGSGRQDFTVYVAENKSQTDRGLRYLHEIPPKGGFLMLQSQAAPIPISVSTAGQALPVDLLFIAINGNGHDGMVMEVHYCIPTDSDTPITSTSPVAAALQLACGSVTRYGILAGDKVIFGGAAPNLGPSTKAPPAQLVSKPANLAPAPNAQPAPAKAP
jgi:uncharacterized membrane protein (UPF0127 family)